MEAEVLVGTDETEANCETVGKPVGLLHQNW